MFESNLPLYYPSIVTRIINDFVDLFTTSVPTKIASTELYCSSVGAILRILFELFNYKRYLYLSILNHG